MAEIHLPDSLARLFAGCPRRLVLEAGTVAEAITRLNDAHPGLRDRLCTSAGAIRRHITLFVDGERAGLGTPLRSGSLLLIIPAVSGG